MKTFLLVAIFFFSHACFAQNSQHSVEYGGEYLLQKNSESFPCITSDQYLDLEATTLRNIHKLNILTDRSSSVLFEWPVKIASGYEDCGFYCVSNYLDQDVTGGLLDWNCGSLTYNGHRGTDICTWPYPFLKMDSNAVEVVAAASGIILNKVDGFFDKNCGGNSLPPNYISILHPDGSVAHYYHLKMNSLTFKTSGQSVLAGEYLGIVGSSGNSTAPHLHFEIWSGSTLATLNDSYAGSCNSLNSNSWWINQKPYAEPSVVHTSVNSMPPVLPACPATETPNEDSCFTAGSDAYFVYYLRNETLGANVELRILDSNGNVFSSWTHVAAVPYVVSYWYTSEILPSQTGEYIFEASYNGDTCQSIFHINCFTGIDPISNNSLITITPNPFNDVTTVHATFDLLGYTMKIFNISGSLIQLNASLSGKEIVIQQKSLIPGLYFLLLEKEGVIKTTMKLIVQDY